MHSRRGPARRIAAALATLASLALIAQPVLEDRRELEGRFSVDPGKAPNVIIFLTDDQAIGTMSVMPRTRDWFGAHGRTFSNGYVTTPQCCPSRATIMTGRYSHNHGVENNALTFNFDQDHSLQEYLQDAGYRTALYGKFLNEWKYDLTHFDSWATNNGNERYYDGRWNVDGERMTIPDYSTDYIEQRSLDFIEDGEENDDQPWYLYVSVMAPHTPFQPEKDYENAPIPKWHRNHAQPEVSRKDKPGYVRHSDADLKRAAEIRALQLRSLMSVDDLVDGVMNELQRLGESKDTLAFFMSDNGYVLGDHGLLGPIASKGNPYTPSIKVPMYMRWPGHIPEGETDPRLAANVDLFPTILDAAGFPKDERPVLDGESLLKDSQRSQLLTEYRHTPKTDTPSWASIRTDTYQYVEYYGFESNVTTIDPFTPAIDPEVTFSEFYYLKADPDQNHNILADDSTKNDPDIEALHAQLERDRNCSGATCP
ncbi:MAG: hypothetical protein QOK47_1594 [Actinomycetota bacterium]|nr:hypothetical protein [Actinomycetota bacterium]